MPDIITADIPLYVCHETPDRDNPRARNRYAVRQNSTLGREIAVITCTGYKVNAERSPHGWAKLFAVAPDMAKLLAELIALDEQEGDGSIATIINDARLLLQKGGVQ